MDKKDTKLLRELKKNALSQIETLKKMIKMHEDTLSNIDKELRGAAVKAILKPRQISIPDKYVNTMTYEKKVLYILQDKELTVQEIAKELCKRDKDSDYDEMYRRTQKVIFNKMKTNEIIKIGDYKAKYKLNK